MASHQACRKCGGTEFTEEAGEYVCQTCSEVNPHMHLVVSTQESVNWRRAKELRIPGKVSRAEIDQKKLVDDGLGPLFSRPGEPESVFVLADIILRAQVSWLIENAGASKELKDIVQKLWFRYLTKALPDVKKGLADSLFGSGKWAISLRKPDLCTLTRCKKSDLDYCLQYYEMESKLGRQTLSENTQNTPDALPNEQLKDPGGRWKSKKKYDKPRSGALNADFPGRPTMRRLLGFVAIGLQYCKESSLISDLLRWVRWLMLPCVDPSDFIPEEQLAVFHELTEPTHCGDISYAEIEWEMGHLLWFIGVRPSAISYSLSPLIHRFTTELNLPQDVGTYASYLAVQMGCRNFHLDFAAYDPFDVSRRSESAEGMAMCFIIFAMRLLFGLNDSTETRIDAETRKLEDLDGNSGSLNFVFADWVRYTEVRRLALFRHTPLLSHSSAGADLEFAVRNLEDEKKKIPWAYLERNRRQEESYYDAQRAIRELPEKDDTQSRLFVFLPVTHRPFRAYAEALRTTYPALSVDFSFYHIDHLMLKTWEAFPPAARPSLETIQILQSNARQKMTPLYSDNVTASMRKIPTLDFVPSYSMRWLIDVCAEMIEQRPESLLGQLMFMERIFFNTKTRSTILMRKIGRLSNFDAHGSTVVMERD